MGRDVVRRSGTFTVDFGPRAAENESAETERCRAPRMSTARLVPAGWDRMISCLEATTRYCARTSDLDGGGTERTSTGRSGMVRAISVCVNNSFARLRTSAGPTA